MKISLVEYNAYTHLFASGGVYEQYESIFSESFSLKIYRFCLNYNFDNDYRATVFLKYKSE